MRYVKSFAAFIAFTILLNKVNAQKIIQRDEEINNIISQVSKDSLRSYVHQLVNFNTRSTLSSQTDKTKGIGAARNWVLNKFKLYAQQSNGRMTAYIDTTTLQPDSKRVNKNILLGNVVAILKGTNTADKRIFLMSGHLDSRRTDVMDSVNFAPGANDDGSGVAAVIEAARVLSSHSFPATIILMAVSGEEQGLFGSELMANNAVKNHLQIEAVLNNDIIGSNNSSGTNIINNTQVRVFSEPFSVLDTGKTLQRIRSLGLENDGKARQLARYVKKLVNVMLTILKL